MPSHRTRAQERADEIDVSPTTLLAELEAGRAELAAAQQQSEEYLTALQRERAEFLNFRRRTEEARQRDLGLAAEDLIRKVLAIADDFDLAIERRPGDRSPPTPGSRASAPSTASCASCSRARACRPSPASRARPSIPASTRPSPTSPAPAGARARSSNRSGAAIDCATASFARPSWPSPRTPNPTTTEPLPN